MRTPDKTRKLISKLQHIIFVLRSNRDLILHEAVDEFLYLQKVEELTVLLEQMEFAVRKIQRLNKLLDESYVSAYCRWRKDIQWFRRHMEERNIRFTAAQAFRQSSTRVVCDRRS